MNGHNDFEISFDERAGIITAKMRGFWPEATLKAFNDEMAAAVRAATMRVPVVGILGDATEFSVQAVQIAEGLAPREANDARRPAGPLAFVVSSVLLKIQAKRVLKNVQMEVFTDVLTGRQWLEGVLAELRAAR
jgi:hypothetical protein